MTICLPLLILVLCVGAIEVPCTDALLLGPDTALVGMRQPSTRAVTVRDHEAPYNYAAHVCQDMDVPRPRSFAFAATAGQGGWK